MFVTLRCVALRANFSLTIFAMMSSDPQERKMPSSEPPPPPVSGPPPSSVHPGSSIEVTREIITDLLSRLQVIEDQVIYLRRSTIRLLAGTDAPGTIGEKESAAPGQRSNALLAPVKVLRTAVKGFASTPFTFRELCYRVEADFPGVFSSRAIISRRFFQLRVGKRPVVAPCDSGPEASGSSYIKHRPKLYRYIGPESAATAPHSSSTTAGYATT